MSLSERRAMIEKDKAQLSRRRQCAPPRVSRSGLYHRPGSPSAEDLEAMRALDKAISLPTCPQAQQQQVII